MAKKHAVMLKDDKSYELLNQKRKEVSLFEDGLRSVEASGNYEWWYTDVKLSDGGTLVIVFYTGPITGNKKFKPYVGLNYTSASGEELKVEYHAKGKDDYSFSKDICDVRIGKSFIKGDLNRYIVHYEDDNIVADYELVGSVPSWRPETGRMLFGKKKYFAWLPSVPEGKINGKLVYNNIEVELSGTGYHDHNFGNIPMFFIMHHWYWGRAKIGDYVVVSSYITANKKHNYDEIPIFMIAKDGKILADNAYECLTYKEEDYYFNEYTKKHVAKRLIYDYKENNKRYVITYTVEENIEQMNMDAVVGPLGKIALFLIGLRGSYNRLGGSVKIECYEDDKLVDQASSKAIWEQMYFGKDRLRDS